MKMYDITHERRETSREVFRVLAENEAEACRKARQRSEEHDWSKSNVSHVDESAILISEVRS